MSFEEIADKMSREQFFEIAKMIIEQNEQPQTYAEYKQSFERQYEVWRSRQHD